MTKMTPTMRPHDSGRCCHASFCGNSGNSRNRLLGSVQRAWGVQDSEEPDGTGNPAYTAALAVLDSDMAQYIHDNTDDEVTHNQFLNAYLASK